MMKKRGGWGENAGWHGGDGGGDGGSGIVNWELGTAHFSGREGNGEIGAKSGIRGKKVARSRNIGTKSCKKSGQSRKKSGEVGAAAKPKHEDTKKRRTTKNFWQSEHFGGNEGGVKESNT